MLRTLTAALKHRDAWVAVNNNFCSRLRWFANDFHSWQSHEWKSLANHLIFTRDKVMSENHWQITSQTYYFISYTLFYVWTHHFTKQSSIAHFTNVTKYGLFWLSIVTSSQLICDVTWTRGILALWCHIRRLFLHSQTGAKPIFTNE